LADFGFLTEETLNRTCSPVVADRVKSRSPLPRFLLLYGAMFAAFGVASPFLPGLLKKDGLEPWQLGLVLAGGSAVRLVAGPWGGRLADRLGRPSIVLAGFSAAAALVATFYAPARGLALLLGVSVLHASVLAPLTPLSDALALGSAEARPGFRYGWVRGAGSAAFIAGTLASGQLVGRLGLGIIVWLNAGLLAASAGLAPLLPDRVAGTTGNDGSPIRKGSIRTLLRVPGFAWLMVIVALVWGSHALHDSFEVIRWRAAGMSASRASILWSISVAAEVLVFVLVGAPLLKWLGPARAMALSAVAGVIRWGTAALTASFSILVFVEPLQGLTFALLHLACMDVIGRTVPTHLAATAQAFYGTVAMGATYSLVTLASGPLYGHFGAGAFWPMAAMCGVGFFLTPKLRRDLARRPAIDGTLERLTTR
jgi:PPP family 3-phenylpropionic acid transporter